MHHLTFQRLMIIIFPFESNQKVRRRKKSLRHNLIIVSFYQPSLLSGYWIRNKEIYSFNMLLKIDTISKIEKNGGHFNNMTRDKYRTLLTAKDSLDTVFYQGVGDYFLNFFKGGRGEKKW